MPNWGEVLGEIQSVPNPPGPLDIVRRKYIQKLHEKTKRNIIVYYSGWLQRNDASIQSSIYDGDINSFMTVINKLDTRLGLDIVLHTPGGDISATEALVKYLRKKFGTNIRCFIPQLAMSAGTMIACSCREIYMGRQSSIGPIDPQFGGRAALAVLRDYQSAVQEIQRNPATIPLWQAVFAQISPGSLTDCIQAVSLSSELVQKWLETGMFDGEADAKKKAKTIVEALNNHDDTKTHARHIDADRAKEIGLKIEMLEEDDELQDLVLTVHHACMHTFALSNKLQKMVENQNGIGVFTFE